MANFFSKFTKQVKDTVENTVKPAVQQTQQNNARPQAGAPKTFTADEVFQEAKAQLQAGNVQQGMNNLIMLAGDGYVSAMTELADIYYLNTYGQGQNIPEFFKYTKMAAEAGAPLAAHNMGFAYKDGVGVPQNFQESVKWYKIAAERGAIGSMDFLGQCYDMGSLGLQRNEAESLKWTKMAADNNQPDSLYRLAIYYFQGKGGLPVDYVQAHNYALRSAEQGVGCAQNFMGYLYDHEFPGIPTDFNKAVMWFEKAAAQNDGDGLNNLGRMYDHGRGVIIDKKKAFEYYSRAWDVGNMEGGNNLAYLILACPEIPKDYQRAFNVLSTNSQHGNGLASFNLGIMYRDGVGVAQNINQAKEMFTRAANQGYEGANEELRRLG